MPTRDNNSLNIGQIDWSSVLIYATLVVLGWVNIYSVAHDGGTTGGILDFGTRYGKQAVWIGICVFTAAAILLIDDKYYHIFAYPAYWAAIALLIAVIFLGTEIKGARAWIFIGGQGVQPAEFAKITTALALARYVGRHGFSPRRMRDVAMAFAIIILPILVIVLQRDAGSAIVYAALLVPLYREGVNGWIFVLIIAAVLLFIFEFLLTPFALLALVVAVCVAGEGLANGRWRTKLIYLAALTLGTIVIYFGAQLFFARNISLFASLLAVTLASIPAAVAYAYRHRLRNVYKYVGLFVFSLIFVSSIDYIFDNVLESHQQERILLLLGIEGDLAGVGYQTNQSKIAIGSGGWFGKGYLEGTQTRFNFVPEQSTDYIFCTVGEEWGFAGSFVVLGLFCLLIVRLMRMAERQTEAFNRIYIHGLAAMFLLHVIINIGMTVGLMPVIGITLPLFSYGGSSLLAFSILFFIAIKLGAAKRDR
ncbi:MAG: rod shape-determining protein RodA [Rikenellaceae bacterium]|nr:rod shape-determining protein RodA [Rikenellaceae bacterium]MCL2692182.1 rod shape-determining protein RodA [Rikenellaceae bacterium]